MSLSSVAALVVLASVGCQYPSTIEPLEGGATMLVRERMERFPDWEHNTIHRDVVCSDGRELLHHLSTWDPTTDYALAAETARPLRLVLVDLRQCTIAWSRELEEPGRSVEWNAQGTQAVLSIADEIVIFALEPRPTLVPVAAREWTLRGTFITAGPDHAGLPAWSPSGTRLLLAERTRAHRPARLTRLGCWSPSEGLHMSSAELDGVPWLVHACWSSEDIRWACPHPIREADCAAVAATLLPVEYTSPPGERVPERDEPTSAR